MSGRVSKCVLLQDGTHSVRSFPSLLVSAALAALLCAASPAAELPYDEHANASEQIGQALLAAQAAHKNVLLVFGANWCPDCRVLDLALHGKDATSISDRFVIVKVDVGNFDKNLDLVKRYGVPLRKGIPAAALVSGEDKLLYVTKAGELAAAHRMAEPAIVDFFTRMVADAAPAGR
jgi:thioredoxin 1